MRAQALLCKPLLSPIGKTFESHPCGAARFSGDSHIKHLGSHWKPRNAVDCSESLQGFPPNDQLGFAGTTPCKRHACSSEGTLGFNMESRSVDELLEHYLTLLDEYTTLRSTLSTLQSGMYYDVARANFSAERGSRYGQDHYDDRMQALRRVHIRQTDAGVPSSSVSSGVDVASRDVSEGGENQPQEGSVPESAARATSRSKDPLRWFGILTPMPLRLAQSQGIQAVEQVIPRLASLSAEME